MIGEPTEPVWSLPHPHHPHGLACPLLLLLDYPECSPIKHGHIHKREQVWCCRGEEMSEGVFYHGWDAYGHGHCRDSGPRILSDMPEDGVRRPVLEVSEAVVRVKRILHHFRLHIVRTHSQVLLRG